MKTLLNRILCIIMLLIMSIPIYAQNFEGVWAPSASGRFGNMKIRKTEKGYLVQIKDHGKIISAELQPVNGVLRWDILENQNYGSWWIGTWPQRNESGHILVGNDNGRGYGTNGEATKIYDSSYRSRDRSANIEKEYLGILIELKGEDLIVSWRIYSDYIADGRVVFMQSSNWIPTTYTNW